jgi:uncharacterized Tic20 family protein
MKNMDLSQKLKELRARKGFSQEQLAYAAAINLRTVQRIESGETEPRGDTLKRLANALNITPDELIDWTEQEDNNYLVFYNLSAFSFLVFPLLGIIVPLALWFLKKDKIRNLNLVGKRLLNFQITWCIIYYLPAALFSAAMLFHWPLGGNVGFSGAWILTYFSLAFYGINILFIAVSAYRTYVGKTFVYGPAIPFLR